MERRTFLQVGAGTAASGVWPEGKKIRAGMVGTQHSHADGKLKTMLDSPDYEVAGVSESDAAARKKKEGSGLYQGVRWASEEELFGDPAIDLIAVETLVPDLMRCGQRAIAAGKHLHIDKPPSPEMAPFRELVEEARRKRLLLQTGYIWRFHQGFAAAFEVARKGWLGRVYMVRGTINTDLTAASRSGLARYRGGMMFELGCHMIDRVVDLWGRPNSVRSWLRHDTETGDALADNTLAVFEYSQGLAVISSGARMPLSTPHRSFELTGTEGAVMIQPVEPAPKIRVNLREARGPYRAGWQEVELPPQPRYVGDFKDLARALKSGQPLKYSYDHELLVQEALLRACGEKV